MDPGVRAKRKMAFTAEELLVDLSHQRKMAIIKDSSEELKI